MLGNHSRPFSLSRNPSLTHHHTHNHHSRTPITDLAPTSGHRFHVLIQLGLPRPSCGCIPDCIDQGSAVVWNCNTYRRKPFHTTRSLYQNQRQSMKTVFFFVAKTFSQTERRFWLPEARFPQRNLHFGRVRGCSQIPDSTTKKHSSPIIVGENSFSRNQIQQ